jgi:hypothetical protein
VTAPGASAPARSFGALPQSIGYAICADTGNADRDGTKDDVGLRRSRSDVVVESVGAVNEDGRVKSTATEWVADIGPCGGDSGSPALDGAGLLIGIMSRGSDGVHVDGLLPRRRRRRPGRVAARCGHRDLGNGRERASRVGPPRRDPRRGRALGHSRRRTGGSGTYGLCGGLRCSRSADASERLGPAPRRDVRPSAATHRSFARPGRAQLAPIDKRYGRSEFLTPREPHFA